MTTPTAPDYAGALKALDEIKVFEGSSDFTVKTLGELITGFSECPTDGHYDTIRQALALAADPWNTNMDEAPRDGTEILADQGENRPAFMKWVEGDGYALWIYADEILADVEPDPPQPMAWMIPAAPAERG